ncbi:MAG: metal/formaldehyde-sensitive transcriptional repressor [Pseudomonadota bacterium]|nr:metal/formaldehyde-sensitive transcriptional repressor [Pseudomonadota bacterium]
MSHTLENRKKLTTRVNKIQGQLNSLKNMLEGEGQCMAVLQQIAAIRGATNGLMKEVIKGHMLEHIAEEDNADVRKSEMEDMIKILDSYMK